MIKNATYTSVWDGGYEVTTNCKINTKTHEVFDIETVEDQEVDTLDREYVTIDEVCYPVKLMEDDEITDNDFWRY